MINLACGVIRISNKCSCLDIFDQQGNLNLIPLVVDFLSYHLVSELQAQDRIYVSFAFFFSIWFLFTFIFLVLNRPRVQNSIFALFKILRGENESFICVNECKQSGLKFLECIHVRECCEVLCISITYFLQQSFTNRFEDESSWRSGEWYEPRDINHTICFNEDVKKRLSKLSKDVSIHATLKKNKVWLL